MTDILWRTTSRLSDPNLGKLVPWIYKPKSKLAQEVAVLAIKAAVELHEQRKIPPEFRAWVTEYFTVHQPIEDKVEREELVILTMDKIKVRIQKTLETQKRNNDRSHAKPRKQIPYAQTQSYRMRVKLMRARHLAEAHNDHAAIAMVDSEIKELKLKGQWPGEFKKAPIKINPPHLRPKAVKDVAYLLHDYEVRP